MRIEQIKKTWAKHLEKEDGMALISVKDFKWLVEQADALEQVKGAYEDRVGDIDSLERTINEIREAYESKDSQDFDEYLHDLFFNQLVEDY
ncbi:hypothetical protein [Planococcus rifietoensis]|uniref:hypothetical protein n=1 Tax=Planococcus rifietoensis TaxID=200991 RepID=UPI00384CB3AC